MLSHGITVFAALLATFAIGVYALKSPARSIVVVFLVALAVVIVVVLNSWLGTMSLGNIAIAHGEPFHWLIFGGIYMLAHVGFEIISKSPNIARDGEPVSRAIRLLTIPTLECVAFCFVLPVLIAQLVTPFPVLGLLACIVAWKIWGFASGLLAAVTQVLGTALVLNYGVPVGLLASIASAVSAYAIGMWIVRETEHETA